MLHIFLVVLLTLIVLVLGLIVFILVNMYLKQVKIQKRLDLHIELLQALSSMYHQVYKKLENDEKFSKERTRLLKNIDKLTVANTEKWLQLEVTASTPNMLPNNNELNNNKGF